MLCERAWMFYPFRLDLYHTDVAGRCYEFLIIPSARFVAGRRNILLIRSPVFSGSGMQWTAKPGLLLAVGTRAPVRGGQASVESSALA